jgi:hypothetical protein
MKYFHTNQPSIGKKCNGKQEKPQATLKYQLKFEPRGNLIMSQY